MASAAPASPRPDAGHGLSREAQVRAEQIRSVYRNSPTTTIGSLIAAAVLVATFWNHVSKPVLFVWIAIICVHQAIRVYHYLSFRKATATEQADPRWGRLYTIAAATAGCIWGSAGVFMFVPDSIGHQAVLAFVLYGIATVSMTAISAYAPAFYCLIPLTLTPFIARLMLQGGSDYLFLSLPGIIVLIVALSFGRNVNRLLTESINKRFENLDLIERLKEQMQAADSARHQAEVANRAKSKFLAAASHDLRQPLHALGLLAAALDQKVRYPEVRGVVESINASVAALEALFNELLDISKLDAGAVQPKLASFPIQPLLARLRAEFQPEAEEKNLRLEVAPTRLVAHSDPILFERILRNLISNALRYTNAGGVLVGARRRGDKVRLEVWDTGAGIAAAERERIFEEFYQLGNPERHSKRGLGLGLAIVRRLAALLDAPVGLRSAPGRGSMFSIEVPRGAETALKAAAESEVKKPEDDLSGKLIVVIDDEEAILDGTRVLLTTWNCEVVTATSVEEALEKIGDVGRYPDLIIADYRLRENETGADSIRRMRSDFGTEIPAILVTGSTTLERAAEAERDRFRLLNKPVMPEKLRAMMGAALRNAGGRASRERESPQA
jgi:signal transduction histidine kinase